MKDLADELPFSKDVVSQVDYNSRLRLALCFVRMKKLLEQDKNEDGKSAMTGVISTLHVFLSCSTLHFEVFFFNLSFLNKKNIYPCNIINRY